MLSAVKAFVIKRRKELVFVLCVIIIAILGTIDYRTTPDLLIFYLIPVIASAMFASERSSMTVSVLATFSWFACIGMDMAKQGLDLQLDVVLNLGARAGIFLLIAVLVSQNMASRRRQEDLMQFVVHDLRSPLTNVLTGLQTLQQMSADKLDDLERELVDLAVISSNRMLTMINSMLDLPRLETGRLPLHLDDVPVHRITTAATQQVALWARQSDVRLVTSIQEGVTGVRADKTVTTRVIVNIMSNALKFSPQNGTIRLTVTRHDPQMLRFAIQDEGPGIPPEWVNKVFDKFSQVDARRAGAASSGLGLTFCQLAVKAQGGTIWLESELGVGTTVLFTLPSADVTEEGVLTAPEEALEAMD